MRPMMTLPGPSRQQFAGSGLPGESGQEPLRRGSVVDRLDAKPLELLEVVPHVLEHLGRVRLPLQDLADYSQRLASAVGPRGTHGAL